jgi:hypothetical protein
MPQALLAEASPQALRLTELIDRGDLADKKMRG